MRVAVPSSSTVIQTCPSLPTAYWTSASGSVIGSANAATANSAPELGDALEEVARSSLHRLDGSHVFLDRCRRALEEELREGRHDADHVAGRLTMTPRTLQRRLARENTSFRQIRDAFLRRRAEGLLCDSDATLQQVSVELGYADPPSFSRAFRRWTGMAPGAWRERSIRR